MGLDMARGSQSSDVEILVHVAAPGRTADDVAYRQLAQAYLSFQPHRQTAISAARQKHKDDDNEEDNDDNGEEEEEAGPSALSGRPFYAPFPSIQEFAAVPSGQAFVPESQDLSFRSALDNRSSPPLRVVNGLLSPQKIEQSPFPSQASSWCAPPSHISDSYPLPDAKILHVTPTRVLERYLKGFNSSRELSPSSSPSPPVKCYRTASSNSPEIAVPSSILIPDSEQGSSQSLSHFDARQVIPVTPVVPGALIRKRREPAQQDDQAVVDETHISGTALSQTSGPSSLRAESAPPPPKRQKSVGDEASVANLLRSSSDTGPATRRPISFPSVEARDFGDALEIRPPSPPVGVTDIQPPSLVSEKLAKLARDLSSRYRPKVRRPIEPFERGYWLLDCTGWSETTRLEAWVFLANYLRSGLAGWGVWCRRDSSRNWIRLYCWGHVAKHTYLLLYLASGRHMKATGANWLGGDGEPVLEVPPTAERRT